MQSTPQNGFAQEQVIETASATTSRDNAGSTPFALAVALLAVVITTLLIAGIGSCTSTIFDSLYEMYGEDLGTFSWDDEEGWVWDDPTQAVFTEANGPEAS